MAVTALEITPARRCSMAAPSGAPAPTKRSRASSASPSTRASPCTRPSPTSRSRRRTPAARSRAGRTSICSAPSTRPPGIAGSSSTCRTAGGRSRSASSIARCACPIRRAPEDFGNGFLMRHGYTVAWVGWQPDVPRRDGLMALSVPAAADGARPISGLVRCEFRPNGASTCSRSPTATTFRIRSPASTIRTPSSPCASTPGRRPWPSRARSWRFARRAGADVVPGSRPRAPRDGLRARQDLRLLLSRRAPAARRARLHRGEGHRCVPALRRRGVGQPLRGLARSRLRLRRVAERAVPPPSPLPRARRGRATGAPCSTA